jgi:hypothetical protein
VVTPITRFLAIYGVGTLMAYSIVHYKTPWCIIAIAWPLLYVFGAVLLIVPKKYRPSATTSGGRVSKNADEAGEASMARFMAGAYYTSLALLLSASFGVSIWLNYFRCSTFEEPYVYVQTYNDIFKMTGPLLTLAKQDPTKYQMIGHLIRGSTYPLPWILGDFTKVGYYEGGNMPANVDGDFLLVQQDKVEEVEKKLHDTYFTEPVTVRPYQDTSKFYMRAQVFQSLYPGRIPEFVGKPATP